MVSKDLRPDVLHIAYVGPVDYASSSAPAQRMKGIVQALRGSGHAVSVGSAARSSTRAPILPADGPVVTPLGELPDASWSKLRRVLRGLVWGGATCGWVKSLDPPPQLVILYGTSLGYLLRLLILSRKMKVPLVIDATEWYDSRHLPGGRFGPFSVANAVSMRYLSRKVQGVIAISRYLERHFSARGIPTLRVPPLFAAVSCPSQDKNADPPLTLCYVGSPGLKDRTTISNLVALPRAVKAKGSHLVVHIVGVDKSSARALVEPEMLPDLESDCLVFHGQLASREARRVISESHFSVLQRSNERYAHAGFPSKVPESLMLGTPVMANLTSDLRDVLVHEENAIILVDESLSALAAAVGEALSRDYVFSNARISASACRRFSPITFTETIDDFLKTLL